jgi:hypothetical protein
MTTNNGNRWTQEEEEQLRQLVLANTPSFEIAETLGRKVSAVYAKASSLGLTLSRLGIRRRALSRWG